MAAKTVTAENRTLLAGGGLLAGAMFAANAGNYLLNVVLGRWLTTGEFADANLMVTLMLLVTAIAVSLQLIAARFAGMNAVTNDTEATAAMARGLERSALVGGFVVALVLIAGATWWRDFFNSESAWPFVVLGVGMPAYLVQAVGRGVLQGQLDFRPLAGTFIYEMVVRVVLGVALVALGLGVLGATIALTASFIATWWSVQRALGLGVRGFSSVAGSVFSRRKPEIVAYAGPVAVLLLGQIIINNGDVLISKQSLDPTNAGRYAAIALVGRAVFFLSWSVATTLFPAATQRQERGGNADGLLYAGLAAVVGLGLAAIVGARLLGGIVLGRVFGADYADVSVPLAWYAFATAVFAMANLVVSHHLALGQIREAVLMLGGAVLQTVLLVAARGSTDELISAQVLAMLIVLAVVSISHMERRFGHRAVTKSPATSRPGVRST